MAKAASRKWCFTWVPKVKGTTRAALLKSARWPVRGVITIGFLDGNAQVKERVVEAAKQWVKPGHANLTFVFKKNADAMVRISFRHSGSWSVLGTQCLTIPQGQATMNYGWLKPSSTDAEVNRVVLHEFGHALGLIHEHQNPLGKIHWDKAEVYKDLSGPPNSWDKATIDANMFEPYKKKEVNATRLDRDSIMMYAFPPEWTTDGVGTDLNARLSARDKMAIRFMYP